MENNIKPANDPNVSAALSNVPKEPTVPAEPVVNPVEPVVVSSTVEPAAPVKPAVEPVVEPVKPEVTTPEIPEYIPETYTSFMKAASSLLSEAGLNPKAVSDAITAADGVVTKEVYDMILAKVGKAQADLLVDGFSRESTNAKAAMAVEAKKVFDLVGGEAEWNKIAAWTATPESGLTKEAAAQYNAMLNKGGIQAELAAKAIKEAYMASPGFTQEPTLMQGGEAPNPVAPTESISRAQYVSNKSKAIRENNAVEVASLEARARYTMKENPAMWRGTRFTN